jgi:hypothetical protein
MSLKHHHIDNCSLINEQVELLTFKKILMTLLLAIEISVLLSSQRMSGQQFLRLPTGSRHSDLQQHKCLLPRSRYFLQHMRSLGASRNTSKGFIATSPVRHPQELRLAFSMLTRNLVIIIIGMISHHSIHGLLVSHVLGYFWCLYDLFHCSP